jgi:hypothetical protein
MLNSSCLDMFVGPSTWSGLRSVGQGSQDPAEDLFDNLAASVVSEGGTGGGIFRGVEGLELVEDHLGVLLGWLLL